MWNDIETTTDYLHFSVASKTVADLIIEKNREKPRFEKIVDGYTGFCFWIKNGFRRWRCIGASVQPHGQEVQ